METKKSLFTVPAPSTQFLTEAYFDDLYEKGVFPAIRFTYEKDGVVREGGIKFSRMAAMRTRTERCCKVWHSQGAYDTLVEVENSSWAEEIYNDTQEQWRDKWEMHHYMIYLDSAGCFEVIAESWKGIED